MTSEEISNLSQEQLRELLTNLIISLELRGLIGEIADICEQRQILATYSGLPIEASQWLEAYNLLRAAEEKIPPKLSYPA